MAGCLSGPHLKRVFQSAERCGGSLNIVTVPTGYVGVFQSAERCGGSLNSHSSAVQSNPGFSPLKGAEAASMAMHQAFGQGTRKFQSAERCGGSLNTIINYNVTDMQVSVR